MTSRSTLPEPAAAPRLRLDVLSTAQALTPLGRIIGAERVAAEPQEAAAPAQRCAGAVPTSRARRQPTHALAAAIAADTGLPRDDPGCQALPQFALDARRVRPPAGPPTSWLGPLSTSARTRSGCSGFGFIRQDGGGRGRPATPGPHGPHSAGFGEPVRWGVAG
ncbi:hypothetical protein AB0I68_31620 [Streptomyces sp. NPDC050448]|uniref:hypothetical protein n=1 Tax=Streptomyces sp. NPDC050448 TaxID=3155404 RepID=UPI003425A549